MFKLIILFTVLGLAFAELQKTEKVKSRDVIDNQLADIYAPVSVLVPETPSLEGEVPLTDNVHPPPKRRTPRPPKPTRERTTRPPRPTRRPPLRIANPNRTRKPVLEVVNAEAPKTGSSSNGPAVFNSYLFTLVWPPTLRKDNPRGFSDAGRENIEEWTISGLLPEEVTSGRCRSDHRFEVAALSASLGELSARWPSYTKSRPSEVLWRQQWSRNGVCFNMTVADYFAKAVELSEQLPVQQWLEESGIRPSSGFLYHTEDFERALAGKVNPSQLILTCKEVRVDGKRVALLKELSVCVARDGLSLTDCKKKSQPSSLNSCKGTEGFFYLPATATVAAGSPASHEGGNRRKTTLAPSSLPPTVEGKPVFKLKNNF